MRADRKYTSSQKCFWQVFFRQRLQHDESTGAMRTLSAAATISVMDDLARSHTQLRGALIFAARRIRKLTFGRADDPALPVIRKILADARRVADESGIRSKRWSRVRQME